MDNKELATKVISDVKAAPEVLEGIKKELVALFNKVVMDNAEMILKLETEDEFYDLLATIADMLLVLPQPLESFDGTVIKIILKKVVDPILDKFAGKTWYEKMEQLIASAQLTKMENEANV